MQIVIFIDGFSENLQRKFGDFLWVVLIREALKLGAQLQHKNNGVTLSNKVEWWQSVYEIVSLDKTYNFVAEGFFIWDCLKAEIFVTCSKIYF